MILNYSWAVWLAWLLGALYLLGGLLSLAGPLRVRAARSSPFLSRRFHLFAGICCVVAGAMIAWYPSRPFGLLLGLLICLATVLALLRHRHSTLLPAPLVLGAVTLLTAWGLRLL